MIIVAVADNDYLVGLKLRLKADVVLACGDIADDTILKVADAYTPDAVYAVRGNHDVLQPFPSGVVDLHLNVVTFRGLRFGGFAGSWRYKPEGHFLYQQEDVDTAMADFPPVDVFIAHNAPAGIHEADQQVHQGFRAFNDYIARTNPRYFIHGHHHVNAVTVVEMSTVIGVFGEKIIEIKD